MSEPKRAATEVTEVVPRLFHWTVFDDRIDFRSDAYALMTKRGAVLIDPLPLDDGALDRLGRIAAVCITIQSHQRSSWRIRGRFGAEVWAPRRSMGLEETPDHWYDEGDRLAGDLLALHAPGPCDASFALFEDQPGGAGILFIGDLLTRGASGPLGFVPDEYQDEPRRTRTSVHHLLELVDPETLCPGHGAPIAQRGGAAMRRALIEDAKKAAHGR
jgi:glyoxylase-like metal-dependent hydrolase (beta-lactamase superfamily II)